MANRSTPSRIIGVRMSPKLAKKVKEEAAKREISIRKLFEEMWVLYSESGKK
jgi:predicted HicB family RNase H-like nuclease